MIVIAEADPLPLVLFKPELDHNLALLCSDRDRSAHGEVSLGVPHIDPATLAVWLTKMASAAVCFGDH